MVFRCMVRMRGRHHLRMISLNNSAFQQTYHASAVVRAHLTTLATVLAARAAGAIRVWTASAREELSGKCHSRLPVFAALHVAAGFIVVALSART